jgi:hypothetical protein
MYRSINSLDVIVIAFFSLLDVSIVIEKKQSLEEFGQLLNFSVEGFYGSEGQLPVPPGNHVCIATIEKVHSLFLCLFSILFLVCLIFYFSDVVFQANAIVNGLIEDKRLSELGCLVVDEIRIILFIQYFTSSLFLPAEMIYHITFLT